MVENTLNKILIGNANLKNNQYKPDFKVKKNIFNLFKKTNLKKTFVIPINFKNLPQNELSL